MLYTIALRRFLFTVVLALLICDASGLEALVVSERCTALADTLPDNACPSTCVRCACGQPIVAAAVNVVAVTPLPIPVGEDLSRALPSRPPHDIFHVPKSTSQTR